MRRFDEIFGSEKIFSVRVRSGIKNGRPGSIPVGEKHQQTSVNIGERVVICVVISMNTRIQKA